MQVDLSSVQSNAANLLRDQSLSHVADFAFDQITVRVRSNSDTVLDDLRKYLRVFETSAAASLLDLKYNRFEGERHKW